MSAPHIEDDLLDQYALGSLRGEVLAPIEEHLLVCTECQDRLIAVDEFVCLFRAAATQPDARPRPLSLRLFHSRVLAWAGAAAVVALVFSLISTEFRRSPRAPTAVFMHALRGPEAASAIPAGKPARLIFDLAPTGAAREYEVQIVDLLGTQVLSIPAEFSDGHLSIPIKKLGYGSYWVRVYRRPNNELIAEYGLRTE